MTTIGGTTGCVQSWLVCSNAHMAGSLCCAYSVLILNTSLVMQDYFNTEKGLGGSRNERGVSNENQQKILEWLKNNP